MGDDRKFYRTVLWVEVLSEEELGSVSLGDLEEMCGTGHCSGTFIRTIEEEVDSSLMSHLLLKQGSDPEFLLQHDEGDECPLCQAGTIEKVGGEARCCGECGNVWDLRPIPPTREIIFVAANLNHSWTMLHHPVPVEVRDDMLSWWAEENLLPQLKSSGYFLIMPYDEIPANADISSKD
jgi:hypothetical protein